VKRVVNYQIKCRPFTDFARFVIVPVLPNIVKDKTGIESAEIVEQARVPVVSRIRAKSRSYEAAIKIICKSQWRRHLRYKSIQVVAIKIKSERPEVTMVEDRRIQLIASRVIETFGPNQIQVLNTGVYAQDRAGNWIALDQVRKCTTYGSAVRQGPRTTDPVFSQRVDVKTIAGGVAQIYVLEVGADR